jgi:hypothetical protein
MARIAGVTKEQTSGKVRELFEDQERQYGAVLNTARIYALRPTIYEGAQAFAIRD